METKYGRWVGKHEYDGLESVKFKLAEYIVDNVKEVLEKQGTISLEDMKAIEGEGKAVVICCGLDSKNHFHCSKMGKN